MLKRLNIAFLVSAATLLGACATEDLKETIGLEDYSIEYKKSKQTNPLEVPPDLSSSTMQDSMEMPGGSATYSEFATEAGSAGRAPAVLPPQEDIKVERDGDKRWLVVNASAEQVWPKIREFWLDLGFLLKIEDPRIGIMETDWKENRADIPDDMIRDLLKSVLDVAYSAPTRDMFRVRIEEGESPGKTEVFVSHRGVMEKVVGDHDGSVWETRPSEPELEAEMLRRMMVFLGTEEKKARARLARAGRGGIKARLVKDREGNAVIDYKAGYPRAWRIVGLALDRVGFTVEDRDRSKGLYYVRYSDPLKDMKSNEEGLLSSLVFWGDDEKPSEEQYQVNLAGDENTTQIIVLDKNGRRDKTKTSKRILTLLYEQIK
ncbi:MAG: outer membrane protein assembly factor BamC [Gammaproteobacteria bacterium]|nr:MAG: outer membrane protein assembly factor BamC [Gammaproteobacteria bacterium]